MDRDMATHVGLANMVLRIMQCDPIESLDEDSVTARTVKMYYFDTYANCLCQYPWTFATFQEELQVLATPPVGQYKYGYKLPVGTLGTVWVRHGTREGQVSTINDVTYEIFSGDVVCTDADGPLYIRYISAPPARLLPPYFVDFFVHSLVEELSAPFGYNLQGQAAYHERIWGKNGKLGYALRQDRANRNVRTITCDSIGRARNW